MSNTDWSRFVPRPLLVSISSEDIEGYVGELVPLRFKVQNEDEKKVFLRLSIFLQPSDEEDGMFSFSTPADQTE